ncbi:MAG TPA: sugar ABC transporter permease [Aggregatilineales bacterium]|nr:sugar ABC transporter permease [Anaerolineales bacterium]HRE48958.1 sugar ABC transporter permease [Aggregatilineales bacterium]
MTTSTLSAPTRDDGLRLNKDAQEALTGLGFVAPALLVVIFFVFIPMIFAFVVSFTNWTGLTPPNEAQGVGLANYEKLLIKDSPEREAFGKALKNTAYYALGVVPAQTALSLLLAVIVNQRFLKMRGFFRTAFYFPSITSAVVIGTVFLWLFNREGIINKLLVGLSGGSYRPITWLNDLNGVFHNIFRVFGVTARTAPDWLTKSDFFGQSLWNWLSGPSVTMLAIMLLAIWTTSGTLMLIFLAALQDVPAPLYEAASVDGATRWQQFRKITLPMLRPATFFVITLGLIGTFQVFDQIFVISKGAPAGTTTTIAYLAYSTSRGEASLSAATAFVLFVIIVIFTLIQRRLMGKAN